MHPCNYGDGARNLNASSRLTEIACAARGVNLTACIGKSAAITYSRSGAPREMKLGTSLGLLLHLMPGLAALLRHVGRNRAPYRSKAAVIEAGCCHAMRRARPDAPVSALTHRAWPPPSR